MNEGVIDLRGTSCPLTLLKIKQYLYQTVDVPSYTFWFDDAGTAQDLPLFLSRDSTWTLQLEKQQDFYMAICRLSVSKVDDKEVGGKA